MSLDRAVLEAAATWYVDLRCAGSDEGLQATHRQWLASDPRHVQAWQRLARLQDKLGQVAPEVARPVLGRAHARRREVLKVLAVLLVTGGSAGVGWRTEPVAQWKADQRTATGERRRVQWDDGTQLQLNTASAVDIRYSPSLRVVQLLCGEIAIETAPDPLLRPFIVHTADGSLRALGTRFTVRREETQTLLTVQEHAVEVRPASLAQLMIRVQAGEQLRFGPVGVGVAQPATPEADAWTRGLLVASDWRLEAFLAELQRYRPGYLQCADAVAGLRISGAFQVGDTESVLENIAHTLPVRVRQFTRYWTRIEAV